MGHGRWPPERRLFNSQKIAVNDGSGFKTRYMRAVGFEWAQKPSDPMYKVVQGTRSYAPPAAFEAEPPGGESGITIFMQNVTDVPGFMGYLKSIGYEDQFEVNIYVSDTPVAQDGHSLDEVRIPALSVFTHRLPKGGKSCGNMVEKT
jgi:hypothetical protein